MQVRTEVSLYILFLEVVVNDWTIPFDTQNFFKYPRVVPISKNWITGQLEGISLQLTHQRHRRLAPASPRFGGAGPCQGRGRPATQTTAALCCEWLFPHARPHTGRRIQNFKFNSRAVQCFPVQGTFWEGASATSQTHLGFTDRGMPTSAGKIGCKTALAKRAVGLRKTGCKNYYSYSTN